MRLLLEEIKQQQELIERLQEEAVETNSQTAKKDAHARLLEKKIADTAMEVVQLKQLVELAHNETAITKQKYNESIEKLEKSLNHVSQLHQKIQASKVR